mmetsp:Transcript_8479/g.18478  ORF Transcript_8479/g.18478 Transcript_8479/m.18478 type:complete len:331 (-) Transcript_8479:53-1045(-)
MPPPPDINSEDFYRVLGVERSASDHEIGKAYKKLALKYHPDKNPDNKETAEENFKKITEAYEALHDPDKRKSYDQFGKAGLQGHGGPGGNGGVSFQQADEIFKAFFGENGPSMFFGGEDDGLAGLFGGRMGMPNGTRVMFRNGMSGGSHIGGKGGGRRPPPQPFPQHAVPKGTHVVVRGLTKAAEHNGKVGRITAWDQAKVRYEVELEGNATISLRPSNITQAMSVELVGIESMPELNGQTADIVNYTEEHNRYTLRLKTKMENGRDVVGLQPGNVILRRGTRVVVSGLSNEQFNGQMAQIVEVHPDVSRYTVHCENGKQIKIKYDNVLC